MQHPIELGNILLILMGIVLFVSGPIVAYRTAAGMIRIHREDPTAGLHWGSNLINFLIAGLFFVGGIFFVINNLRGNPLS